jgi:hypothetical protein
MKKVFVVLAVTGIALSLIAGCAQKAASSKDAIETSKTMQTIQQKADYLVGQANAFYNSKDFQQAIDIAQYVLANVDKDSVKAKDLIEKAKAELAKLGQQKLDEMKSKIGIK